MNKTEFKNIVKPLVESRNKTNEAIVNLTNLYINQLPYKIGDKVKINGKVGWIVDMYPYERFSCDGAIELRVNWMRTDGKRATRVNVIFPFMEEEVELYTDDDNEIKKKVPIKERNIKNKNCDGWSIEQMESALEW